MSGVMKTCVVKFIRQGVGISLTDVEYADSTSNTTAPTAGWQTNAPTWQNGHYIWTRTKIVYTDGTTRYSNLGKTRPLHGKAVGIFGRDQRLPIPMVRQRTPIPSILRVQQEPQGHKAQPARQVKTEKMAKTVLMEPTALVFVRSMRQPVSTR